MTNYVEIKLNEANDNLPNKLSELLEVAINDLEKAVQSDKYNVAMGLWHTPTYKRDEGGYDTDEIDYCSVCLAGSALAFTGKMDMEIEIDEIICDKEFPRELNIKLAVLNEFNQGRVDGALETYGELDYVVLDKEIVEDIVYKVKKHATYIPYMQEPNLYVKYLNDVLRILKEEGM